MTHYVNITFFYYLCVMNFILKAIILTVTLVHVAMGCRAKEEFSALEQQQIRIETPCLFARSNTIEIDFTRTNSNDYSFPLPVGTVEASTGQDLEIATKKGDAVKAMFDGVVRLSRNNPPFGNVIVIRHSNGLETVYGHNAQNLVKSGDRVKAGQTIAIVGGVGARTYLLFSIMVDGKRINPSIVLSTRQKALRKQKLTIKRVGEHIEVKTLRVKSAAETPQMSMDTNNPFGGKATYLLDLDAIKASEWHYPLDNAHVISGYGGKRRHAGVDIKNGPGTNVYAAFDGMVVQSGVFSGYGKCITLRHPNGLETRYSHNSKNYVNVGDKVKAGQVIGLVGRTGRATTEHLHFETRINGKAFDPNYVFDHKTNKLAEGVLQFKPNGKVVRLKK